MLTQASNLEGRVCLADQAAGGRVRRSVRNGRGGCAARIGSVGPQPPLRHGCALAARYHSDHSVLRTCSETPRKVKGEGSRYRPVEAAGKVADAAEPRPDRIRRRNAGAEETSA